MLQPQEIKKFLMQTGREQQTELDQPIQFAAASKLVTPSSLKTDRFISMVYLHWSGRIAQGATTFTLAPDSVFNLINEVRLRGTHVRLSTFTPLRVRGAHMFRMLRQYRPNYSPSTYGVSTLGPTGSTNYDIDFVLPIPLWPLGIPWHSAIQYSIKGPEWPGNLRLEIDTGDGTSLGTTAANVTFSAKGGSTGSPVINVYTVRPLLSDEYMARITPAVPLISYDTADAVAQGSNVSNGKILDLVTDRFLSSLNIFTGTLYTTLSSGLRAYTSYSDAIITNAFVSLDDHQIGNNQSNLVLKEHNAFLYGKNLDTGLQNLDYAFTSGNPDSAFQAAGLTAARRFQLKGNVTGGANQAIDTVEAGFVGAPIVN